MDFPRNVVRICMEVPILYFKGSQVEFFLIMMHFCESLFLSANIADPDEMPPCVAFHLVFTICQE